MYETTASTAPIIADLRSDTVTRPTPAMRDVMARAPVGDDIYRDDPSVHELEDHLAALTGKQAALFTPSGTMANQLAIGTQAQRADEVLCHELSHIMHFETGAVAGLWGVSIRTLDGDNGIFTADQVAEAVRPPDVHQTVTRLVVIENTNNRAGGTIWPIEAVQSVTAAARNLGLTCHLDGARLWNAAAATGVPIAEWTRHFDTVSLCFSKGLGAPVGSILCGPAPVIASARRLRKMLGGAMRQSGILAAAARYAVEHHAAELARDHDLAKTLAARLADSPAITVERIPPTNMIFFRTAPHADHAAFLAACAARGILVNDSGGGRFRAVLHRDITPEAAETAAETITEEAPRHA